METPEDSTEEEHRFVVLRRFPGKFSGYPLKVVYEKMEDELFIIDVESNYIKLTPVKIEPRYTSQELRAIDHLVERQKGKAKVFKAGEEFSGYIKKKAK